MRKFISLLAAFLISSNCFAADISVQKVEAAPLKGGISFNTITFYGGGIIGWVTASSVIGRKEVTIINTSTTENLYLTDVTGSSVTGTLGPKEEVTFKAAYSLDIFVSSNSVSTHEVEFWEIK